MVFYKHANPPDLARVFTAETFPDLQGFGNLEGLRVMA